jgi:AcrR family transcriptional regulator
MARRLLDSESAAEPDGAEELPRRKYASALMRDRRDRILAEAQGLLDEMGVEGFTIRELSRRADVAQRTLYNVFGSKEEIVAAAIDAHFAELVREVRPTPADTLEEQLVGIRDIARATIGLRRYATAMVGVFFSPAVDRRIYDSLYRISQGSGEGWSGRAEKSKLVVKMSPGNRARLNNLIVNQSYANVTDWAAGRIDDEEFVVRAQLYFLSCIRAYLRASHRAEADALIAALLKDNGALDA